MNAVFVSGLTLLATSGALLGSVPAVAGDDACAPHVIQSETKFPIVAQMHTSSHRSGTHAARPAPPPAPPARISRCTFPR